MKITFLVVVLVFFTSWTYCFQNDEKMHHDETNSPSQQEEQDWVEKEEGKTDSLFPMGAASSPADIPDETDRLYYTTDCVPVATISCCVVLILCGIVLFYKGRCHRAELQRIIVSIQNKLDRRNKEQQDNMDQKAATLQDQISRLEESRDQLSELLERKNKEELENMDQKAATLQDQISGLNEMRDRIIEQLEEVEAEKEENKKKLQSVETEITEREKVFDKPEELLREKDNLLKAQCKLDEIKRNDERLKMKIERLLEKSV